MAESCLCFSLVAVIVVVILGSIINSGKNEITSNTYTGSGGINPSSQHAFQPPLAPSHPVQSIPFQATTYQTDIHLKSQVHQSMKEVIDQSKRLQDWDLSFQNLQKIHFSVSELVESNMTGSNLIGASFSGGNLRNVNFEGAFLSDADFSNTTLHNVNFFNCDLCGADFKKAVILNSSFEQADLTRAEFLDARIESCSFTGSLKTRALNLQD